MVFYPTEKKILTTHTRFPFSSSVFLVPVNKFLICLSFCLFFVSSKNKRNKIRQDKTGQVLFLVLFCFVLSCRVVSCRVVWFFILSCHVLSCRVLTKKDRNKSSVFVCWLVCCLLLSCWCLLCYILFVLRCVVLCKFSCAS